MARSPDTARKLNRLAGRALAIASAVPGAPGLIQRLGRTTRRAVHGTAWWAGVVQTDSGKRAWALGDSQSLGTAAITAMATTILPGGAVGMAIFIVLQTILIIAFGEIVPKSIFQQKADTIVGTIIYGLRFFSPAIKAPASLPAYVASDTP